MRTKVAIDTSVLRDAAESTPAGARWDELAKHRDKFHFGIYEANLFELARAILEKRLPWEVWAAGRSRLAPVIDPKQPGFSRYDDPTWRGRVETKEGRSLDTDARERSEILRDIYEELMGAPDLAALETSLDKPAIAEHMKTSAKDYGVLLGKMRADIESGKYGDPEKLFAAAARDTEITVWKAAILRVRQSMATKGAYDPEKRPNDAPDLKLLVSLEFPAYILTHDGPLMALVEQTERARRARVLRLEQFADAATTLPALVP